MRPRFGTRGLPPEVHASWRRSLSDRQGVPARILAWARSQDGFAVGSPSVLSVGGGDGTSGAVPGASPDGGVQPRDWRHIGWHEIEHGGWNAESRSLSWTLYGGRRGRVELAEPARLPELFRERVAASIAVERFVPLRGERGVTVTARRDLGAAGTLSWHSTLTRGLTGNEPGVADEIAAAEADLQSEYGSTPQGW
jgi:hypothetical protein